MAGNDNGRSSSTRSQSILHNGSQRRAVQMIEMRVRYQHQVDGRQVAHSKPGTPQPLQHKQPAREVRIDYHALPTDLHKKAGVPDESDSQLAVRGQPGLVRISTKRRNRRVTHQSSELRGAFAESPVLKCCLDHPKMACLLHEIPEAFVTILVQRRLQRALFQWFPYSIPRSLDDKSWEDKKASTFEDTWRQSL